MRSVKAVRNMDIEQWETHEWPTHYTDNDPDEQEDNDE
jgi:hypothetical protein